MKLQNALLHLNRYLSPRVSVNQLVHFNQLVHSGRFSQFDYNSENLVRYNSLEPPDYQLENVKTNVYLYHASEDFLISKLVSYARLRASQSLFFILSGCRSPQPNFAKCDKISSDQELESRRFCIREKLQESFIQKHSPSI